MVDRICLKVLGPGFVIGMTIDMEPEFPIVTVGDLLRSLRNQREMAVICQYYHCDTVGDLYYRNIQLLEMNARLLEDVGVDIVTLTQGGVETLEYRIRHGGEHDDSTMRPDASNIMGDNFKTTMSTVLAQEDPIPTLTGLLKVLGNICQNPDNPKYQKIKRANPKFLQLVGSHPGGIQVLLACGFQDHVIFDDDGIEYIQYQQSDDNLKKLKQAVDIIRHMQEELKQAQSLLESGHRGPLEMVPITAQQSLQIYRHILGPRHVLVAKGMGLVATVLYAQGQDQAAMDLCLEAKAMVEELGGPEHPELAPILANLAFMMRNDDQALEEMEQYMTRALALQQPVPTLSVLNNSAGIQMTLGHYDTAIAQWQQVLEGLRESDTGRFVILGNLARARAKSGDGTGAERDYQVALRVGEQQVGQNHLQLAGILANLAAVQDSLGKVHEAESNFARALNIRESTLSFGNPLTQEVFRALCEMLERHKQYSSLSSHLQRCCDCTQQMLGQGHPETAKSIVNAALVLHRYQNNTREAIPLLQRALGIYEGALGPEHSATVMTRIHLGSALRNKNPQEAESTLVEAVSTAEFRNDRLCLGPALSTLGALDVDKDDFDIAFVRLERGLEVNIQEQGNNVWYTEMTRRDLGRAYQATGRPERAKNLYQICLTYFQSKLIATDERLVDLLRDIDRVNSQ